MSGRRWWWRALAAVLGYAAALGVTLALGNRPDLPRLALVVLVVVAAGSVVLDGSRVEGAQWPVDPRPSTGLARADPRTAALLRVLENHRSAAEPDPVLRDRLRELTDRALRSRHDLEVDDPRAAAVIGPELAAVLGSAPRRLRVAQIERLVRGIEEL